jgi:hypothetical protein
MESNPISNPTEEKVFLGGLIWGKAYLSSMTVPFPFAKLRINSELLTFRALGTEFSLLRSEILGIEMKFAILAKGLKFYHQKADFPPQIRFLTFQSDEILSMLSDIPRI